MASLKTTALLREFYYNGVRVPDPGPDLTVEQVRDLLTPNYPEIAIATLTDRKTRVPLCVTPSRGQSAARGDS